ncbi:MAG: hypothetical protein IPI85_15545 [Dehalococcoidia bacterium]|nr:hypothetical protein [Dehalococcoidia bacterium]
MVCVISVVKLKPQTIAESSALLDHDHVTGQVRGFLCSHCNIALGAFRDNPESMRAAAAYIERNRGS